MEAKDRIIVALDVRTIQKALGLGRILGEYVWGFKIGLELIHSEKGGPSVVRTIQGWAGDNIFYDCKLHDTPEQVVGAVRNIIPLGVKMFSVHCLGGFKMMQAAREAAKEEANKLKVTRPLVLGVTILTSLDYAALCRMDIVEDIIATEHYHYQVLDETVKEMARESIVENLVVRLAELSREAGLDGVIASPQEIKAIRRTHGRDFLIVTPGIRAADAKPDDQKRTATAAETIEAGADYLVIGRPITQAPDPVAAARNIAQEIEETLAPQ